MWDRPSLWVTEASPRCGDYNKVHIAHGPVQARAQVQPLLSSLPAYALIPPLCSRHLGGMRLDHVPLPCPCVWSCLFSTLFEAYLLDFPRLCPWPTADSQESAPSAQFLESVPSCLTKCCPQSSGSLGRKDGVFTPLYSQGILTCILLAPPELPWPEPREQSGSNLRCYAFLRGVLDVTAGTWVHTKAWDLRVQKTCCRSPFALQPSSGLKCPSWHALCFVLPLTTVKMLSLNL